MITKAINFIHPNDLYKILATDEAPASVCISAAEDGLKIISFECNAVPYRVTKNVPERLIGDLAQYYIDIEKTPPKASFQRLIYGCIATESDWIEKSDKFGEEWKAAHPNWSTETEPCTCELCV